MEVTLTVPPQGLLIAPAPVQETVVKALETPYASYAVMKGAPGNAGSPWAWPTRR